MALYRARIIRRDGRRLELSVDAMDYASLLAHVENQCKGYLISARRIDSRPRSLARVRVPWTVLLAALDSLELMLASGVRINAALRTLADCAPAGPARSFWTEVAHGVEENGSFAGALGRFPRVFNRSMVGIIEAHESAGRLTTGVRHVRDYIAQMREIRRESVRGMAYPAFVFVAGVGAALVLCIFTLPRFARMLSDIGVRKINPVTAFFFGLSNIVTHHSAWVVIGVGIALLALWSARMQRFKPLLDRILIRMPVIRGAIEALSMARICATFHALSESGIRVVDTLEACAAVAGNYVYSSGLGRVVAAVRDNTTVGVGFERAGVFAPEVVLAVKSAEGSLPDVFGRLASYYAGESKHRVGMALRLIEPIMLALTLAWVFGVALAVILPVAEVVNEIR
jgi:type II secretory pathway component PulF